MLTVAFLLSISLGMDLSIGQRTWLRLRLGEHCWPLPVVTNHTATCRHLSSFGSRSLLITGVVSRFNFIPVGVHWDPVVFTCISLRTNNVQYLFLAIFIVLLDIVFCSFCCCWVFFTYSVPETFVRWVNCKYFSHTPPHFLRCF